MAKTHGMSGTPEYQAFMDARWRCETNQKNYENVEFLFECFEDFYEDLGPRPNNKMSLDRIDNDGNYEPGNCRWATPEQQGGNKGKCRPITYKGKKYWSMAQAARELGISYDMLKSRLSSLQDDEVEAEIDKIKSNKVKKNAGGAPKIHGMSHTPVYITWAATKSKCLNPNNYHYAGYGGNPDIEDIFCERWMKFINFYEDMGDKPVGDGRRIHLHRLDESKGYSPDNCIWAYSNGEPVQS